MTRQKAGYFIAKKYFWAATKRSGFSESDRRFERDSFDKVQAEWEACRETPVLKVSLVHVHLLFLLHDVVVDLEVAAGAGDRNPVKRSAVATFPRGRNDK